MTIDKVPGSEKKRRGPGGSRKGIPNKTTAQLKDMILQALDGVGGVDYLIDVAREKPAAFIPLLAKVLPLQVAGTGPDGEHMFQKIIVEVVKAK